MGGVFLVELMFSWPGLGFYAMRSISLIDFPAIMGVAILMTTIYAIFNFIADLLYGYAGSPDFHRRGRALGMSAEAEGKCWRDLHASLPRSSMYIAACGRMPCAA